MRKSLFALLSVLVVASMLLAACGGAAPAAAPAPAEQATTEATAEAAAATEEATLRLPKLPPRLPKLPPRRLRKLRPQKLQRPAATASRFAGSSAWAPAPTPSRSRLRKNWSRVQRVAGQD